MIPGAGLFSVKTGKAVPIEALSGNCFKAIFLDMEMIAGGFSCQLHMHTLMLTISVDCRASHNKDPVTVSIST